MGGDHAPAAVVEGAMEALGEFDGLELVLAGDERALRRELSPKRYPAERVRIIHAPEVVGMDEPALQAIRKKKNSSIRKCFDLVKSGEGDSVVTAGHSGVAMALALLVLGTSKGVDRPAIATVMPTLKKPFVLIDAGANVDCTPRNLLQFALMADSYAKHIFNRPEPKVALLSIGEEATKGNELTREAFKLLEGSGVNFIGNIEGKDIFQGAADVVVCDGFVGNIVLKTSEGLAEVLVKMLKREIASEAMGRVGYLFIKSALRGFKRKTDYDEFGGAPLLGVNGTCIISHGRSTAKAIKNAIRVASEFSRKQVFRLIEEELAGGPAGQPADRKGKTIAAG
jgi:glycerol-3-phosphate acyltransferase PlsX